MEEPTLQAITQLLEDASYYKVEVNSSQKKSEIKQVLIDYLIDEQIIPVNDVTHHTSTLFVPCQLKHSGEVRSTLR